MTQRGVAEQRVNGGEPGVAGPRTVAPVAFEVVEEGTDERGVEVGDVDRVGWVPSRTAAKVRRHLVLGGTGPYVLPRGGVGG